MSSRTISHTQQLNPNMTSTTVIINNNNNTNSAIGGNITTPNNNLLNSSSASGSSSSPSSSIQFTFRGGNNGNNSAASSSSSISNTGNINLSNYFDGSSSNNINNNTMVNNNSSSIHNDFANNGAPIVIDQLEWKDTYRHIFANLPLVFFHIISLLITFFLVFIAIADRRAMQKTWYLLLEGIMVLFFTFEVASRYILSRTSVFGSYFKNKANLIEAIICAVCLLMFLFLLVGKSRSARGGEYYYQQQERNLPHAQADAKREATEHELVVVVRFAFQLFRGVLYLRNVARARRDNAEDSSLASGGGGGGAGVGHRISMHHHHHHQYFQRGGQNNNNQV